MEWLIASVLIIIASTSTIATLAITAVCSLVLGEASVLLYLAFSKTPVAALAQQPDTGHLS